METVTTGLVLERRQLHAAAVSINFFPKGLVRKLHKACNSVTTPPRLHFTKSCPASPPFGATFEVITFVTVGLAKFSSSDIDYQEFHLARLT